MIKTVMMICMMMAFAASAQAESVLLTLPFGVVLGKPISKKSLRYATPHYDAFYEFQRGWYADKGKGGEYLTKCIPTMMRIKRHQRYPKSGGILV